MSFKPGYKARVLVGDFALYTKLSDMGTGFTVDMLEPTTFGDGGNKRALAGLTDSTFNCEGFIDADTNSEAAAWTGNTPLSYSHTGFARGESVWLVDTLKTSFEPGSQVAGMSSFSLNGQTDGPVSFGVSLHDLTAETATGNGTGHDGAASSASGGVGHLHVTSFSGLTNAVIKIQHSTDNNTFADLITFSTATGTTSERKTVTGTVNRYLRYALTVTGTGSVTFQTSFARH